jgi:SWI/SNF-related matrix-associated actin-dependent regulator of chromatin subfamily A member 2/4
VVDDDDPRATVIETTTGRVLSGDDAPRESQVQGWLEMHPGWARAPREDEDNSDLSEVDDEDRAGLASDKLSKYAFSPL